MRRLNRGMWLVVAAVVMVAGCAGKPSGESRVDLQNHALIEGVVTGVSDGHGNVYTSIKPEQYETLGLKPGMWLRAGLGDQEVTLIVGQTYTDVPPGTPVAVLHREGLTFAIRDGNFSKTYDIEVGTPFRVWLAR